MIRTELRGHQKEAVEEALPFDGFLLVPEQRTGKCLISLKLVDIRKPKNLWIVCPIQAIKTWKTEIAKHLQVDWDCKLVIVNYEELSIRRKMYYKMAKKIGRENLMIIGDELHKIKRRGSKISRALRQLSKYAKYKLGLTGTPIGNGLHDIWALMDFVDKSVFGPWSDRVNKKTGEVTTHGFESNHLIYGGFKGFKITGYKDEQKIWEKFHSRSYRVTLREARGKKFPLKMVHRKIWVDLESEAREFYERLEDELEAVVNQKKVKVPVVVALTMKLQQVTGGYVIDSEDGEVHQVGRSKMKALKNYARARRFYGQKFVIVSRFIHEIEEISLMLDYLHTTWKVVRGGEPYDGHFDTDAIIIQVQSGVAVDMALANYVLFYSWDFSYINYEQVKFRVLNFEKPWVSFSYLLTRDTIDEQIYQAVTRKKNLAQLVLDKFRKQRYDRKSRKQSG